MNRTGEVSDSYNTQITPAGWTFSVWGVIYTAQVLWIVYGWSFVFRPATPRAISFVTYIFYGFANLCSIVWTYSWGNLYPQVAFAFIALCGISLYATDCTGHSPLQRNTCTLLYKEVQDRFVPHSDYCFEQRSYICFLAYCSYSTELCHCSG